MCERIDCIIIHKQNITPNVLDSGVGGVFCLYRIYTTICSFIYYYPTSKEEYFFKKIFRICCLGHMHMVMFPNCVPNLQWHITVCYSSSTEIGIRYSKYTFQHIHFHEISAILFTQYIDCYSICVHYMYA